MLKSVKSVVRNVKGAAYTPIENKVRAATSNEPWGCSSSDMREIADYTKGYAPEYDKMFAMVWKRVQDREQPRHVHKALLLIEYLLRHADNNFVEDVRARRRELYPLVRYKFLKDGEDVGGEIRRRAALVVALIDDKEKLEAERTKAQKLVDSGKFEGIGGNSGFSRSGFSRASPDDETTYEDHYGDTRTRNDDDNDPYVDNNNNRRNKTNAATGYVGDFDDNDAEDPWSMPANTGTGASARAIPARARAIPSPAVTSDPFADPFTDSNTADVTPPHPRARAPTTTSTATSTSTSTVAASPVIAARTAPAVLSPPTAPRGSVSSPAIAAPPQNTGKGRRISMSNDGSAMGTNSYGASVNAGAGAGAGVAAGKPVVSDGFDLLGLGDVGAVANTNTNTSVPTSTNNGNFDLLSAFSDMSVTPTTTAPRTNTNTTSNAANNGDIWSSLNVNSNGNGNGLNQGNNGYHAGGMGMNNGMGMGMGGMGGMGMGMGGMGYPQQQYQYGMGMGMGMNNGMNMNMGMGMGMGGNTYNNNANTLAVDPFAFPSTTSTYKPATITTTTTTTSTSTGAKKKDAFDDLDVFSM